VTHQAPDTPLETGESSVRGEEQLTEGMKKLAVRRKRMSGAKRKRIRKAKQAEAAMVDSAADEGTRNRRAEPSASSSSGTSGPGLHGKRVRETGDSPLQIARPQKRPKTTTKSYRDVVQDSLNVFIINEDAQNGELTPTQASLVENSLMAALDKELPSSENTKPCFYDSGLARGLFKITCVDAVSLAWLTSAIREISSTGDLKLCVKTKADLPSLTKATIWIPGPPSEDKVVFTRLAAQNPGLLTENWKVYHSGKASEKGKLLVVGLDDSSIEVLRLKDFRPFYGLRRTLIKLKSGPFFNSQ
jgi:hypothetical protein